MEPIYYIDRITKQRLREPVYGEAALNFLYKENFLSRSLRYLLARNPLFSSFYGFLQKCAFSRKKIPAFIKDFNVDATEFADSVSSYGSFNDFFIRKLKSEARPIAPGDDVAIIPADARYRFYQNISKHDGFLVKGERFELAALLDDAELASRYEHGTMIMARLCPTDYHRFHFPCQCVPGPTDFINGWLYSVNPIALKKDIHIFSKNKRTLCHLKTQRFGEILFLEIGATNVGTIHETYLPNKSYPKGAEKGYFSFGGSSLILLFEPERIQLDADLIQDNDIEMRCLMGQSMGRAL